MSKHSDQTIEAFYELRPINYKLLESFHVRQVMPSEWNDYELSVEMELRHENSEDGRLLVLSFQGVQNLIFTPLQQSVVQIILLEISSIKVDGWEAMNYSVKETEDETLAFLCENFTATIKG